MNVRARTGVLTLGPLLRKFSHTRWYRALGLGSLHSVLRLVLGFLSIKVTAVYLGPSGLALLAQLGNFISICHGVLGAGIGSATARLYPEFQDDQARRRRFLTTAWRLAVPLGLAALTVIVLASAPVARWLLTTEAHATAVTFGGVAVACLILNSVILNAINGAGEMGRVVVSHAVAGIIGFAIFVPASILWGLPGGLIGFALSQAVALPVSLAVLRSSACVAFSDFRDGFDRAQARQIAGFVPMLIAHSAMSPLALMLIRDMVAARLDLDTAGMWQATWRLSEVYLSLIMASVSLYFLPRLGEVIGTPGLRGEILRTFVRSVGVITVIAFGMFLLRDPIVRIVFTDDFLPVRDLMPIQLLGDVLKMAAWIFGFVLVALVRSWWYIGLEIAIPAVFYGVALVWVPEFGVRGVTWAYCASAAVHLAVSLIALRDVLFAGADGRPPGRESRP